MAGYDETVIFDAFRRMALEEGSAAAEQLKGMDFGRELVFVSESKSTSGDPLEVEKEVAAMIDKALKLVMPKAKHFAGGSKFQLFICIDGIDDIQKGKTSKAPVETGKSEAVIDEIQTEKMDKAPVEAGKAVAAIDKIQTEKMDKAPVDGEKNQFSTMTREAPVETGDGAVAIDKNQTERCADSDPPAGKHRLDGDFVSTILAMPTELPCRIPYSRGDNVAQLLGLTEEKLEKRRELYREAAARSERISKDFAAFQANVRDQSLTRGYVEVDDEYLARVAELQEYNKELWKDHDRSGFKFYDPDRVK